MASWQRVRRWFSRLLEVASTADDLPQDRAYKSTHLLITGVTAPVVSIWAVVYWALDRRLAAAIPLTYTVLSVAGILGVARTKQIRLFRNSQMVMWLVLPFVLQWTVGGFANSSAVSMWAVGAPLLASLVGAKPVWSFAGFGFLSVVSGVVDPWLSEAATPLPRTLVTTLFVLNLLGVAFVVFVSLRFFILERERAAAELERERALSERLLLNILPETVATRLKAGEDVIADRIDRVTILFADLVGSTPMSSMLTPDELVAVLNRVFTRFDDLATTYGLEKIKTIGDAYMVVGGLPPAALDYEAAIADMALAMREELSSHSVAGFGPLRMRYGIHTGTVVAGVIGKWKFSYDLWGDAVNTAARMESHGMVDEIQVTEDVYRSLSDRFRFDARGPVDVRGKGMMETYLLKGRLVGPEI